MKSERSRFDIDSIWRNGMRQSVVLPPLALFSFTSIVSTTYPRPASDLLWLALIVLSGVLAWLVFTGCAWLLQRAQITGSSIRVTLLVCLYGGTEAFRVLLLQGLGSGFTFENMLRVEFILGAAVTSGVLFFGLLAIAVSASRSYRDAFSELSDRRQQLQSSLDATREARSRVRSELERDVRDSLREAVNPTLARLQESTSSAQEVTQTLLIAIDESIRPMSHALYRNIDTPPTTRDGAIRATSGRLALFRHSTGNGLIQVRSIIVAYFLLTFIAVASRLSLSLVVVYLGTAAGAFVLLWGARTALSHIDVRHRFTRATLASVAFLSLGIALGVTLTAWGLEGAARPINIVAYGVIALSLGWIPALFAGLQDSRRETLNRLAEVLSELEVVNARLRAVTRLEQKRIAIVLHGEVQSTLLAAALNFQRAIEAGENGETARDELREHIEGILELALSQRIEETVVGVRARLESLWGDLVSVELKLVEAVEIELNRDSIALNVVFELVAESLTNALKHSGTSHIDATVTTHVEREFLLVIRHRGTLEPERSTNGLGAELFSALTIEWWIAQQDHEVVITARIPKSMPGESKERDAFDSLDEVDWSSTTATGR